MSNLLILKKKRKKRGEKIKENSLHMYKNSGSTWQEVITYRFDSFFIVLYKYRKNSRYKGICKQKKKKNKHYLIKIPGVLKLYYSNCVLNIFRSSKDEGFWSNICIIMSLSSCVGGPTVFGAIGTGCVAGLPELPLDSVACPPCQPHNPVMIMWWKIENGWKKKKRFESKVYNNTKIWAKICYNNVQVNMVKEDKIFK